MSSNLDPDATLGKLVINEDVSVRLANCVQKSALAALTVSKAFEMGPSLEAMCLRVPAMGQKSVRELHELLARLAARSPAVNPIATDMHDPSGTKPCDGKAELLRQISRLYSAVSLAEAITTIGASVRLSNCIERAPFKSQPLGQFLVIWQKTCDDLLQVENFGRTSLYEFRRFCTDIIGAHLAACGFTEHHTGTVCSLLFGTMECEDDAFAQLAGKLAKLPEFSFDMLRSGEIQGPNALAEILLQELDKRSCDVLVRRYGLRGIVSETLEQIAESYGLTRERIRQLESKALKRMAQKGAKLALRESLIGHGGEIWKALVGDNDFLRLADLPNSRAIPPYVHMLMDVQGISTTELIGHVACRWQAGWFWPDTDTNALDGAKTELGEVLIGKSLPRPLPLLTSAEGQEISQMVAELGLGLRTYRGYVLNSEATARSQIRLVDLHRQMGNGRLPHDVTELAVKLGGDHRGGATSARYVTMMMERHPHLFLEADNGQWFGIGCHDLEETTGIASSPEAVPTNGEGEEEGFTTAGLLREILSEEGPTRLSSLVEMASRRLPSDRSTASIGPTLITNPEFFVRVLPGVYGLKAEIPSAKALFEENPEYLLNAEQARYYALGRMAGEPWNTFPLWSPSTEAALCSWALHNAETSILQSLVSVATFDAWPIDEHTKQEWKDFANRRNARFLLHFQPREEIGYALPMLDRVLAACLQARASGQFNWMIANRILNRRVNSHISAGMMALMCSLDALKIDQDGNWQLPHSCGSNLEQLIRLLSGELHDNGAIDWNSSLGARILAQAGEAIGRPSCWVDRRLLAAMLASPATANRHSESDANDFIGKAMEAEIDDLQWTVADDVSESSRPHGDRGLVGYSALEISSARVLSEDEGKWSFEDDFTD